MTKEREGLIEVLGFLSAQSQELHDVSTIEEQLELQYDMELNKTRLDNDVLRARGRELTDQIAYLQDLLHLKSRACTPSVIPLSPSLSDAAVSTRFEHMRETERQLTIV